MTIESTSSPADLAGWDGTGEFPFYFEVFGETAPVLDTAYAEVVPARAVSDAGSEGGVPAPVYEYWWTIGHPGHRPDHHALIERLMGPENVWDRLPDPAAHIYIFFPMGGGWRVKEVAATVKYMSPVAHEQTFSEKVAQEWQTVQPFIDGASKLAGAAQPLAGAVAGQAARTLGAMAQLKLSSVPAVKGFEWSAAKVAFGNKHHGGVAQGVMWTLPASMFRELGGRLTGSLAVSFIPDHKQKPGQVSVEDGPPEAQDLLAHAVVYHPDGHENDMWAPGMREFVHLRIAPQLPSEGAPCGTR